MNLLRKDGEMKVRFEKVLKLIKKGEKKFHLKYWTGSNRYRTLVDTDYYNMIELLRELNIKFEIGNDAPKGGVTGDYILIKSDKRNKNYRNILNKEEV